MPQDARITLYHQPSPISAGTMKRVPSVRLRAISPWLAFGSEEIIRMVKSKLAFHTVLLKQQILHAREFCKCSLRNINFIVNHAVMPEKAGCICLINVPARSINHRARCLIRCYVTASIAREGDWDD